MTAAFPVYSRLLPLLPNATIGGDDGDGDDGDVEDGDDGEPQMKLFDYEILIFERLGAERSFNLLSVKPPQRLAPSRRLAFL